MKTDMGNEKDQSQTATKVRYLREVKGSSASIKKEWVIMIMVNDKEI